MMKIIDVLNVPPTYLFLSISAMLILHFYLPVYDIIFTPYSYTGIFIMVTGLAIIVWHAGYFKKYDTPIKPFKESTFLIKDGLYRYTRNPIYLGMVIILFSGAVVLGSLTPFLVIPIFILLIQKIFIEKEEEFLSERFGKKYIEYKKKLRRWI